MRGVRRMKAARIVVLGVAVVAGGLAAYLAAGDSPPPPAPQPVAKFDTVDVLVAKTDIGMGQTIKAPDIGWQQWPASSAGSLLIRRSSDPNAIETYDGAIARMPIASGEPLRDSKVIKAKGSGFMAAILPQGMRAISTEISPETG